MTSSEGLFLALPQAPKHKSTTGLSLYRASGPFAYENCTQLGIHDFTLT